MKSTTVKIKDRAVITDGYNRTEITDVKAIFGLGWIVYMGVVGKQVALHILTEEERQMVRVGFDGDLIEFFDHYLYSQGRWSEDGT